MCVFVYLLITTLLLGGCATIDQEGTTPTADLVSEVTPTEEEVQSPVPAAAFTPTPAFTATPSRSLTATIAALLTRLPTRTPTPSPEPSPLPDTEMIALIKATVEPQILGTFPSPDGQWLAEVIIYECTPVVGVEENAYEEVRITAVDNGTEQVLDPQLQYCGGLGAFGFEGLFWSANGRYFYYTPAREGVPDGCGYWTRPYKRADVTTGETEWLGGGPLSPDETMLATWQDRELVVWDLNEGEVGRVETNIPAEQGPIVWSPNGRSLAHLQSTSFCPSGKSSVFRVDLADMEGQLLLESDEPGFIGLAWGEPERLRLFPAEGQEWRYEFATDELDPVP